MTEPSISWLERKRGNLEPCLILTAAGIALAMGFQRVPVSDFVEEVLDFLAIAACICGFVLANPAKSGAGGRQRAIEGWCLIACGLCLILGRLEIAGVFAAVSAGSVCLGLWRGRLAESAPSDWRVALRNALPGRWPAFWRFALLLMLFETWETAVFPGAGSHTAEVGLFTLLLAIAAVGWAASARRRETAEAFPLAGPHSVQAAVLAGTLCFALFVALAFALRLPGVVAFDEWAGHQVYLSGPQELSQLMRSISNAGGRDMLIYWLPLLLIGFAVARRFPAMAFFVATMLGAIGLELLFKGMIGRQRPGFVGKPQFDSFPSGHALAATILAGSLLAMGWPLMRTTVWRWLLAGSAAGWAVTMALSRVYLGRHFVTDVVGGLLLGAAWVFVSIAIYRAFPRQSETASPQALPTAN